MDNNRKFYKYININNIMKFSKPNKLVVTIFYSLAIFLSVSGLGYALTIISDTGISTVDYNGTGYTNLTGNFSVGDTNFFVDNSVGKVGIGTSAPNSNLQVVGSISRAQTNLYGDANSISSHINLGRNSNTGVDGNNNGDIVIIGGVANTAEKYGSSIMGGQSNIVSGEYATISGGFGNNITADYSAIIGGRANIAAGEYSFVLGKNMQTTAAADRTFVWGYSESAISIPSADSFIVYNSNVGINVTSPQNLFNVNGDGNFTGNVIIGDGVLDEILNVMSTTGDSWMKIKTTSFTAGEPNIFDDVGIKFNNTNVDWTLGINGNNSDFFTLAHSDGFLNDNFLVVTPLGKMGINNTNPQGTLDVNGTLCIYGDCVSSWSGVTGGNSSAWNRSGTTVYLANTDDKIGIGTLTPISELEIKANASIKPEFRINNTGGATGIFIASSSFQIGTETPQNIDFFTNNSVVVTIDTSGNMGIGTTTPGSALEVTGATNSTSGYIMGANTGVTDSSSYWLCTSNDCSTTCQVEISGGIITGCT